MQEAALVGSWWNKLPDDFQTEIFASLPVEFLYSYRIISKQWNDFLSSNYFLTKWAEAPLNRKRPRLVLCNRNPTEPCMAFCFYKRTWIKSCFTFSFLEDWISKIRIRDKGIYCKLSVAGLILVTIRNFSNGPFYGRLCNPYTRTFVQIPKPHFCDPYFYTECIVVDENNNQRSKTAFKVVAVGRFVSQDANGVIEEKNIVEIYEPSQKRWNIAGYFPEDLTLKQKNQLVSGDGSFYSHCRIAANGTNGIVCFTIPLDGNGSAVAPTTIPMLFAPFPPIVRNWNPFQDNYVLSSPRMITCGSRLLLIAAIKMPVQFEQAGGAEGEGEVEMELEEESAEEMELEEEGEEKMELEGEGDVQKELVIILWEFKNERHPVLPSNSPSWEWVEIARMPSFICKEWMNMNPYSLWDYLWDFLWYCCIGVGDYVCFVPEARWSRSSEVVKMVAYNLIDNTWIWLPRCFSVGDYAAFDKGIAFEPSPRRKVE